MIQKIELSKEQEDKLVATYQSNLSVVKTATICGLGKNSTRKFLKKLGVLLSLSDYAKLRTGKSNPFYGKKHSDSNKNKQSVYMSKKVGELNPNYRHGKNLRRPRDFKNSEFKQLRSFVFNRDNYTCVISGQKGGNLHAHHLLPYWVCEEAFFDPENIITVSTKEHLSFCHKGDWANFNADLVSDKLLLKYSIDRERLNELADLHNKSEAIVRPSAIYKTEELSRNI